jgi:hypothetical protein
MPQHSRLLDITMILMEDFNKYCVTGYDPLKHPCILSKPCSQEPMDIKATSEPEELLLLPIVVQLQLNFSIMVLSRKTKITRYPKFKDDKNWDAFC